MIKRLALVWRAPDVRPIDFGRRWRDQAEKALASLPADARPSRLAHCVARPGRGKVPCDGVAISSYDHEDAVVRYDQWLTAHTLEHSVIDDAATTVIGVEERTVFGREWLARRWSNSGGPPRLLLIGFIEAAVGMTRGQFRDYWWDKHRPLANDVVPHQLEPIAYVHDYVLPGERGHWAGVGEMYERSLDVARQRGAWFDSEAAGPLIADEERFLVRSSRQLLITDHEVIATNGAAQ